MAESLTEPHPRSPEADEELGKSVLNRLARRQALESRLAEIEELESRWAIRRNAWRYVVVCGIFVLAIWKTAIEFGRVVSDPSLPQIDFLFWAAITVGIYSLVLVQIQDCHSARREKPLIEAVLELESRTK